MPVLTAVLIAGRCKGDIKAGIKDHENFKKYKDLPHSHIPNLILIIFETG